MAATLIQQASNSSSTTSVTVTINSAPTGNTLVVVVHSRYTSGARYVTGVGCTNVTFSRLGAAGSPDGKNLVEVWYGAVSGGLSGTAVSVAFSGTGGSKAAFVNEFSGVAITSALDGTAAISTGSTSPATTGSYTSTGPDLIFATFYDGLASATISGSDYSACAGGYYKNDTVARAQSASWTGSFVNWSTVIGGLKLVATSTPERRLIIVEEF